MTLKCEFCKREFKRESSLARHMCREKKRWLQRNDQHVRLGLKLFNDWYRLALGANTERDYKEFMKSKYYSVFVRFGLYVLETRIFDPVGYIAWLVKEKIPVDRWNRDSVYGSYLAARSKHETAERALERFVLHAETWSERTGYHWSSYWGSAAMHVITYDIKMGKISPWIFLGYGPAKKVLESMPSEMLSEIADTVDLDYWQRKIDVNRPLIEWINQILDTE